MSDDAALDGSVCEGWLDIKNQNGLHMRPAMLFVDLANQFKSDIHVSNGDMEVDAKSIMNVTMLGAAKGTRLKVRAQGRDAEEALAALRDLVENKIVDEE